MRRRIMFIFIYILLLLMPLCVSAEPSSEDVSAVQNGSWKAVCYYNDAYGTLQIRFSDSSKDVSATEYLYKTDEGGNLITYEVDEINISQELLLKAYSLTRTGCPNSVFLSVGGTLSINQEGSSKVTFDLIESKSVTKKTLEGTSGDKEGGSSGGSSGNIVVNPPKIDSCNSLLGSPSDHNSPSYYIVISFKVVRYVAIILLIVLSVMDMISAVASNDSEILQKTISKIFKRFILCVIIFLLPDLINFILQFIDSNLKVCGVRE